MVVEGQSIMERIFELYNLTNVYATSFLFSLVTFRLSSSNSVESILFIDPPDPHGSTSLCYALHKLAGKSY